MALDHQADFLDFRRVLQTLQHDHLLVAILTEIACLIQHAGHPAGHAGGKVAARPPQHHHPPAGHVFATVIADRFHHGGDAAVAHAKSLPRHAADVSFALGRAVKGDVARDDVLLRHKGGTLRRIKDDLAAGQALAQIIVGVAFQNPRQAPRHEGAEALSGRAFEMNLDGVLRQPPGAVTPGDLAAQDGANDAVDVLDFEAGLDFLAPFQSRRAQLEQGRIVQRLVQSVILRHLAVSAEVLGCFGLVKDVGEIQPARLPMLNGFPGFEEVGPANHFVDGAETQLRHQLAHLLSDEAHEIDHVGGIAGEILAQ